MFPGWLQIALVVLLILLFFGRGKISQLMGDLGKGLRTFRKGLEEDDTPTQPSDKVRSKSSQKAPSQKGSKKN